MEEFMDRFLVFLLAVLLATGIAFAQDHSDHGEEQTQEQSDEHSDEQSDEQSDEHGDEHSDEQSDEQSDEHGDEHSDEQSDEHSDDGGHDEDSARVGANTFALGDINVTLDPMVDINGAMRLASHFSREGEHLATPASIDVTLPNGTTISSSGAEDHVLSELGSAEPGTYVVLGKVGDESFESRFSLFKGETDAGSSIVLILAPHPKLGAMSEAIVYSFGTDDNLHGTMTLSLGDEVATLVHVHYQAFDTETFTTVSDNASFHFAEAGEQTLAYAFQGPLGTETVSFTVTVDD
jgi:hypothetical protein